MTLVQTVRSMPGQTPAGRIIGAAGSVMRASLNSVAIGELCQLIKPDGTPGLQAEVIGFDDEGVILAPLGDLRGVTRNSGLRPLGQERTVALGPGLLGRIIDGNALPIDGLGPISGALHQFPLHAPPPDPLSRTMISEPLHVGVRAIDGLLTCAKGQRVGIFGEPGGGKSTLLASLVRGADCDVCVVGLLGERGREVREFVEHTLGDDALKRSVVVVATSDRPAIERTAAAYTATAVAEAFRSEGKDVLLVVDSLTRFARAQREIALSSGEMPARRGFPNSVFTALPGLLERAGSDQVGTITAFYTVLVEDDGTGDPVAEEVRSILDGHIVLSATLAAEAHYPAIDVLRSKSRLAGSVTTAEHRADTSRFLKLHAKYDEISFLVQVGEYTPGQDVEADRAIAARPAMLAFLRQNTEDVSDQAQTQTRLSEICA